MKRSASPAGLKLWLLTNKMRLTMLLAQRASLGQKSLLDQAVTKLLAKLLGPKTAADDFMRDEVVDADIGFSPQELAAYRERPPKNQGALD